MKAYHIMMGLFLFNISVIVFNSMGIWTIGFGANNLDSLSEIFTVSAVFGLIGLLIAAAFASYFIPGGQSKVVYFSFSVLYMGLWGYTSTLLLSISKGVGGLIMITVFSTVFIATLIAGLYQMVTGGWQSYE